MEKVAKPDRAARVATRFGSPGGTWAGDPKDILAFVEREVKRAVAEEREACAALANCCYGDEVAAVMGETPMTVSGKIAAAIRGRK